MTTIHDERPTRPLSAREFAECIVDTVREPLVVLGADLRVRSANRSFYRSFGVIPEETKGRLIYELGNGQWNIPGLRTLLEEILPRDHSFCDFEVDHVFEGLGRRRMILNARKLWREGNETEMILLAIEDVTDRWRAEVELRDSRERADAHKNEFLAILAHELRNPLAAISNAVAVSADQETKKDLDWSRSVISRQVGHLSRLIDDLLDISRITHHKIQLRKEIIDASPVLRQAVEVVRPFAEARNQELSLLFTSPDLRLHADPMRLEQIVVNLLTNAAKYTPSGGHIQLGAGVEGKEVVILVRDDGVGIPPEMLARMFDLFAQEDRSLAHSEGGLGIGLTLVRSLVEMHGGTVTATSAGPGLGSEFVVRLPAAGGTTAARGPKQVPTKEPVRRVRILVVDDSADTAIGMAKLLKRVGHDVRVAHDGQGAIKSAAAQRPEVILLDIGLLGMDGYEVAAKLRLEEYGREALLIAISGYGGDQVLQRTKKAGFDHHLVKPIDFDALLALLNQADAAT